MRIRWTLAVFLVVGLLGGASVVAQKAADSRVRNRLTAMPTNGGQTWSPPSQAQPPSLPAPVDLPLPLPQAQAESDPIEAVDVFVQRNVKVADDSIKALTQEAEALKGRLAKVEAALARWQAATGREGGVRVIPADHLERGGVRSLPGRGFNTSVVFPGVPTAARRDNFPARNRRGTVHPPG